MWPLPNLTVYLRRPCFRVRSHWGFGWTWIFGGRYSMQSPPHWSLFPVWPGLTLLFTSSFLLFYSPWHICQFCVASLTPSALNILSCAGGKGGAQTVTLAVLKGNKLEKRWGEDKPGKIINRKECHVVRTHSGTSKFVSKDSWELYLFLYFFFLSIKHSS